MGGFQNFAISFTIISILAGCLTSYAIAFNQGGPVAITWGWLLVGFFCIIVSLAMGEIASTYPTAGGLYFWSSKLGSPAWGWFTGWFNLLGQIAVTAAIGFGCAIFMTSWLNLITDGSYGNTYHWIYLTYAGIMLAAGVINMFKVSITAMLNAFSAWWHMLGVLFIVFVLIIVPDHHRSIGYVFGQTINNTGFGGGKTSGFIFFYVFLTGLLMAQYTITGYDASAHMSEETRQRLDRCRLGDGHVGRGVGDLRVPPARRGDLRRSERQGRVGSRHLHRHLYLADVDEHALGRDPALHRRARAGLLHDRLGDLGLADDVRVLA